MYKSKELDFVYTVFADGMFYIYTNKGELALLKSDTERLNIVSQTKVTYGSGIHFSMSTIYNGVLYIRHGNALNS